MVCFNALSLSPPFLHSLLHTLIPSLFLLLSFSVSLSTSPSIFSRNNHCIFRLTALRCRSLRLIAEWREKERDESKGGGLGTCAARRAETGKATKWFAVVVTVVSHLSVLLAAVEQLAHHHGFPPQCQWPVHIHIDVYKHANCRRLLHYCLELLPRCLWLFGYAYLE